MKFKSYITKKGLSLIKEAVVRGTKVELNQFIVSGSEEPLYNDITKLEDEKVRLNIAGVDYSKEAENIIVCKLVIPRDIGGFTMRKIGLVTKDNQLAFVSEFPETYKPQATEGGAREIQINFEIRVENIASISVDIDKSKVFATKEFVKITIESAIERLKRELGNVGIAPDSILNFNGKGGIRWRTNTDGFDMYMEERGDDKTDMIFEIMDNTTAIQDNIIFRGTDKDHPDEKYEMLKINNKGLYYKGVDINEKVKNLEIENNRTNSNLNRIYQDLNSKDNTHDASITELYAKVKDLESRPGGGVDGKVLSDFEKRLKALEKLLGSATLDKGDLFSRMEYLERQMEILNTVSNGVVATNNALKKDMKETMRVLYSGRHNQVSQTKPVCKLPAGWRMCLIVISYGHDGVRTGVLTVTPREANTIRVLKDWNTPNEDSQSGVLSVSQVSIEAKVRVDTRGQVFFWDRGTNDDAEIQTILYC